MNDSFLVEHLQAPQHTASEVANQRQAEALEIVLFDQLIQIYSVGEEEAADREQIRDWIIYF